MWLLGRRAHPPSSLKSEWHHPLWEIQGSHPLILPEALSETAISVTKTDRGLAGRGKHKWILWCFGTFADPPLGTVLVKAGIAVQLGSFHAQPSLVDAATKLWIIHSFEQTPESQTRTATDIGL